MSFVLAENLGSSYSKQGGPMLTKKDLKPLSEKNIAVKKLFSPVILNKTFYVFKKIGVKYTTMNMFVSGSLRIRLDQLRVRSMGGSGCLRFWVCYTPWTTFEMLQSGRRLKKASDEEVLPNDFLWRHAY